MRDAMRDAMKDANSMAAIRAHIGARADAVRSLRAAIAFEAPISSPCAGRRSSGSKSISVGMCLTRHGSATSSTGRN